MNYYDKDKDLAHILVEGTKAVYGSEKSEQLRLEFDRLQQQVPYRRNAEDLTAMVERVCEKSEPDIYQSEVVEAKSVKSIDDAVKSYESKPSMLKVAAKGTLNLVNKMGWYYPLVGALPGRYQEKIAEKLRDNPENYTAANMAVELIGASMLGYYTRGTVGAALAFGAVSFFHSCFRMLPNIITNEPSNFSPVAPIYTALPMYAVLGSILAIKAVPKIEVNLKKTVKEAYSSAYKELEQKRREELVKLASVKTIPSSVTAERVAPRAEEFLPRIETQVRVEEPKPEIIAEEFEEEEPERRRMSHR